MACRCRVLHNLAPTRQALLAIIYTICRQRSATAQCVRTLTALARALAQANQPTEL